MKHPTSPYKKADAYIGNDSRDLRSIFERVNVIKALNQKVLALLDPHIATYCMVANIHMHKLTLMAANGSVATQIRFQVTDLLRKFSKDPELQRIKYIECKVRPPTPSPTSTSRPNKKQPMQPLSQETADLVNDIASSLEDPALKEIMQRIASRVKK